MGALTAERGSEVVEGKMAREREHGGRSMGGPRLSPGDWSQCLRGKQSKRSLRKSSQRGWREARRARCGRHQGKNVSVVGVWSVV